MNSNLPHSVSVIVYPDGRMDPKNTSAYTGLSEKTLAMKRCNGTGPKFVKIGRVFYFQADVDSWLAARSGLITTTQARSRRG